MAGYIKKIRGDGKIYLSLEKPGFSQLRLDTLAQEILSRLQAAGGQLPLNDKSPPEEIYATFGVSKKVFKQAVGTHYKRRRITLHDNCIKLIPGQGN